MAFDLQSISKSVRKPPRIVIYGVPGIGKTTIAAKTPSPIFMPVEDGCGELGVDAFPRPLTYDDVVEGMTTLVNDEHEFGTFALDSLDKLEPLIWDKVIETVPHEKGHKVERIEDYGYGKGYTHALTEWRNFLAGCDAMRERGMAIVLIAHSAVVRFDAPDSDPYDRYQMRLHKAADAAICDWADVVLFANYKTALVEVSKKGANTKKRGVGTGERVVYTTERPAWKAKNRYTMPDMLPLSWPELEKFLLPQ